MDYKIYVDKDICKAETLPAKFYKDQEIFELVRKKIFLKCWHWIGDESLTENKNSVYPLNLYPKFLDEPILITRNQNNNINFFSNVCTHRGNILVKEKGKS